MQVESWILLGKAMADYWRGDHDAVILEHSFWGTREIPLWYYFRDETEMPEQEVYALDRCQGKVLEIGAGAGNHSLALQERGLDVYPVDILPQAASIMRERGLPLARCMDFWQVQNETYDTLLLLMNGIGIVERLNQLPQFLAHARQLLKPGGRLLFDSADIRDDKDMDYRQNKYSGEVTFHFSYHGSHGLPFHWLFLDPEALADIARAAGWLSQIIYSNPEGEYLAELRPIRF